MERLVNVAIKVKQPSKSYRSLCWLGLGECYPFVLCYRSQNVFAGRLYCFDARWLAVGLEWKINVVPRRMALGGVASANLIARQIASA